MLFAFGKFSVEVRRVLERVLPPLLVEWIRLIIHAENFKALLEFMLLTPRLRFLDKFKLVGQMVNISAKVEGCHKHSDMLLMARLIINCKGRGPIVEAGTYNGSSACKLSLIAKLCKRRLIVFDSFKGLPRRRIEDSPVYPVLKEGLFAVGLDEVKSNIAKYGELELCEFREGFFKKTMPHLEQRIAIAFIDVDLVSSTKTTLKHLYPLIKPQGLLFAHDWDFSWIRRIYEDPEFWRQHVKSPKPKHIRRLTKHLAVIMK
jgi:O-methyltransferase